MDNKIKYLSFGLLVASVVRSLILGWNFADVGATLILGSLALTLSYIEKHKTIQEIQEVVNEQNKVIKKLAEEQAHNKTAIAGVKMGMGFQKVV